MEVEEHFYSDNPRDGPPDAWTTLSGVAYYFVGNGRIQAAVQVCPSGAGTPLGLLIMDPERLGPKRRALSFDPLTGLRPSMLTVEAEGGIFAPPGGKVKARWVEKNGLPAVCITWPALSFTVRETFFCPDRKSSRLVREIEITRLKNGTAPAVLRTGLPGKTLEYRVRLAGGKRTTLCLEYRLNGKSSGRRLKIARRKSPGISPEARGYWKRASRVDFSSPLLNHFFNASRWQLPANISRTGKLDGSIWQYNREWARDQAMAALGLILSGQFEPAGTILGRLLDQFVAASGATVDSSEKRPLIESELDQNGVLLFALEEYILWTGDLRLINEYWPKVRAAAFFPLRQEFIHPDSGLLHNRREFWERHAAHGIEDGIELAHQFWVSLGLGSASRLALLVGKEKEAGRWLKAAQEIKKSLLEDRRFGLVQNGRLIKRRQANGSVQTEVHPLPSSGLPPGVPLFEPGRHFLNPDTSVALPVAWEFIPPQSPLAEKTLTDLEKLWNQRWTGGGYGRYHVSSEPDSPGPWPFPSLFAARACFEAGRDDKVWETLRWLERAPGGRAGTWFEFYGPRPTPPYPQVGIVPWTWAEMIILFVRHLLGLRPGATTLRLRPRLLRGLSRARASIRLRKIRVQLDIQKARAGSRCGFWVDGKYLPYSEDGISLAFPGKNIRILARIPPPLRKAPA